jgi:hypothetical protein
VTGVATYTYGRGPDHYVEIPDPTTPGQTIRPPAGYSVGVRDATTANIPVGTTSTTVAQGAHTHAVSFANLPSTSGVRMAIEIDEVSAGVYPTLTAEQSRAGVKRVFNGQIRPTAAQGAQALDKWVNTGAA